MDAKIGRYSKNRSLYSASSKKKNLYGDKLDGLSQDETADKKKHAQVNLFQFKKEKTNGINIDKLELHKRFTSANHNMSS